MAANAVTSAIEALEVELKRHDLWSPVAPDAAAMASEIPFSHDTMNLETWLQWILIPRLRAVMDAGTSLPATSDVASYAEVVFSETRYATLVEHIKGLDDSVNSVALD